VIDWSAGGSAMVAWTLVAHIFGLVLWVSGLLVTTIAMSQQTQEATADGRQALVRIERRFLRGMADPGAALTILAGVLLISTNRGFFLHARWLHIKLGFVLLLIVLHGLVAMRNKASATGRVTLQRGEVRLLLWTIVVVFLLILISTLPGEVFLT
jgi:putative membrane protein